MAYADGNIIIGTSVDVGGLNTGLNKIQNSFKKLGKLAALTLGIKAFVQLGKSALDAASDLQEVQNVVDVAFGDMAYKIENFANTSIEKFGMSELAAKQTAGSYMAMGKSMGLTAEEASDMAVSLTGLSGDMASFLNISQDYARVALSAVYTGETETLKRYGIVLTEANLQQYATSKGIETTVKKMDARDKAILRYMYIMENTAYMEGDFVRTQDSWANSTRILSEVWKQFLIVLGDGLISVLTPLVEVLNSIIKRLITFTQTLWIALSNIFGFDLQKVSEQVSKTSGGVGDLADSTDDLADSIDKAGKKAKKHLGSFDELNNIITTDTSGSAGKGAGLSLGDIDLDVDGLTDPSAKNSPWSDIDNLYDLGKWIGDKISDMLESIDWEKVYQGAKNFGTGLADFLNGLISTNLFKDVGHTIAGCLNTAIYAALSFGQRFDFAQFGQKIAEGINEFFATFDFASLAETINVWVQGLWTTLKELISNIDWLSVLSGIGEFFSNLDPETIAIICGFLILRKLIRTVLAEQLGKALVEGIAKGLGLNVGEQLFAPYIKSLGFSIGTKLAGMKTAITNGIQVAFLGVKTFITKTFPMWLADLSSSIKVFMGLLKGGNGLKAAAEMAFGGTATVIAGIVSLVGGIALAVKEVVDMFKNGWSVIKTILEAIGLALAAVGAVILGAPAAIAAAVAGIVFAISQIVIVIHDNWEAIKSWFASLGEWFMTNVINPIATFFSDLWDKISGGVKAFIDGIANFFEGLFLRIGQFAEGCWIIIQAIWIIVSDWFKEHVINPVVNFFSGMWEAIKSFFQTLWDAIKSIWDVASSWFNSHVIQPIINFFQPIIAAVSGFFTTLWEKVKSVWGSVANWFSTTVINPIKNAWNVAINAISGFFSNLWNGIVSGVKGAMNGLIGAVENAINFVINAINGFLRGFNNVVSSAAEIVGTSWGGVSLISNIHLPRLASGAVIPPNNEFLAILGDQKSGTNIEAPLDTIKQAFMETLSGINLGGGSSDNQDIVVQIDGYEVFRAVRKQNTLFTKSTGVSAF